VSDLDPLSGLSALRTLDVSSTNVSDLGALSGLSALETLNVGSTQVSNLGPLSGLSALQTLYVALTKVSDLGPLSGLRALQTLDVSSTQVSNLGPLNGLSALQTLYASSPQVRDLGPLSGLIALQVLDASSTQVSDLGPLNGLSALQTLNVSSTQVSDLGPLSGLSALKLLDVSSTQVSDLGPLSDLSSLQALEVNSTQVRGLGPLEGHTGLHYISAYSDKSLHLQPRFIETLPKLSALYIERVDGVPLEVLSEGEYSNCLDSFRSWWNDLQNGEESDQEIKIFVLGNGTAGKTQICRQLRGEEYDEKVPSTHGVQIDILELIPDKGTGAVKAKLWDFGGQDIYHGTHALFLEGRAVFILVWTPQLDAKGDYVENGLTMHHHGLVYWLDYVRSLAGEDAALVVVQSKCDQESDRVSAPLPAVQGFRRPLPQVTCSAKCGEMDELKAAISSAARYLLEVHGRYRLPTSWVAVRDRLRELKATHMTLPRERFNELCRESHGPSNPDAVLNYLHRCGEVFYRKGLFRDEIVLDQEWAVRAIYAVLDRKGPCQTLHQLGGVFTLPLLKSFAWHDEFSHAEQQTILGMMESCAICFPLDTRSHQDDKDRLRRYALPDFLPQEKDVTARVEALWRADLPRQKVTLEYAFLHEGILRQLICQIGRLGGPDAAYWRYGCCFYDANTHSRARIRAENTPSEDAPAKGRIILETCDGNARELLARLQKALLEIRIGQPPEIIEDESVDVKKAPPVTKEDKPLAEALKIDPAPTQKPLVYLSYAWGGAKEEVVDLLEERLIKEGYEVKRDNRSTRPGDWISDFMREIGQARRVCIVFSEKYMQSSYCMRELLYLYQTSCGEKSDFLNRIVPLVLEDAKLTRTTDRLSHVRYWQQQLQELMDATTGIDPSMWGGAGADMAMIREFCHTVEVMLRHVSDHLMPRGIKDIEKDGFAAVLAALKAKT
jgi:internalin A